MGSGNLRLRDVCRSIFRVVPTANGQWKVHVMYTNLEYLKGMPYKVGALRSFELNHEEWLDKRAKDAAFEVTDPKVLIVGEGCWWPKSVHHLLIGFSCSVRRSRPGSRLTRGLDRPWKTPMMLCETIPVHQLELQLPLTISLLSPPPP